MRLDRRGFVHSVSALVAAAALAGCNDGEPDDGRPESEVRLDAYLSEHEANLYDGSIDNRTGEDEVTVAVGAGDRGLAYDPAAARIDIGTTVVWEWTGRGGRHNVVSESGDGSDFEYYSGPITSEEGHTWTYTFDEEGVALYYCEAHRSVGHLGALIIG